MREAADAETVYVFVVRFIEEVGYPPTVREIALGCECSVVTAFGRLQALEGQGRIRRGSLQPRTIVILDRAISYDMREIEHPGRCGFTDG